MQIRRTQDVAVFTHDEVIEALKAYVHQRTGRVVDTVWISSSNTDIRGTQYELTARLEDEPKGK